MNPLARRNEISIPGLFILAAMALALLGTTTVALAAEGEQLDYASYLENAVAFAQSDAELELVQEACEFQHVQGTIPDDVFSDLIEQVSDAEATLPEIPMAAAEHVPSEALVTPLTESAPIPGEFGAGEAPYDLVPMPPVEAGENYPGPGEDFTGFGGEFAEGGYEGEGNYEEAFEQMLNSAESPEEQAMLREVIEQFESGEISHEDVQNIMYEAEHPEAVIAPPEGIPEAPLVQPAGFTLPETVGGLEPLAESPLGQPMDAAGEVYNENGFEHDLSPMPPVESELEHEMPVLGWDGNEGSDYEGGHESDFSGMYEHEWTPEDWDAQEGHDNAYSGGGYAGSEGDHNGEGDNAYPQPA